MSIRILTLNVPTLECKQTERTDNLGVMKRLEMPLPRLQVPSTCHEPGRKKCHLATKPNPTGSPPQGPHVLPSPTSACLFAEPWFNNALFL